jgi:hypothetical protein
MSGKRKRLEKHAYKWGAEHYRAYLHECGPEGGYPEAFHSRLCEEYLAAPKGTSFVIAELLRPLSAQIWHNDPNGPGETSADQSARANKRRGDSQDFFPETLNGRKLERSYTFVDPRSAAGYGRVSAEFVSVRIMAADLAITLRKSEESIVAAREKSAIYSAAVAAANGNLDAKLKDIADKYQAGNDDEAA